MTYWWLMVRRTHLWTHDPLTMWWCVVTWQIESIIFPLWQDLWLWNFVNWWLMVRWMHPSSDLSFWPPGYIRSSDKRKTEYFFLKKTYGHQTLKDADILQGKAHNEVARFWSRDHKRSRVKIENLIYPLLQDLYHHF